MVRLVKKHSTILIALALVSQQVFAQSEEGLPKSSPPPKSFELPENTSEQLKEEIKKTSEKLRDTVKKAPAVEDPTQKNEPPSIVDQAGRVIDQVKKGVGKPSPELLKEQTEFYKRSIERATGVVPKKKGTQESVESENSAHDQEPQKATETEKAVEKQEPATVQLIVSAIPVSHLQESLEELESLKRTRRVKVEDVVIAGLADADMATMIAWQKQPKFKSKEDAKRALDKLMSPTPYQQLLSKLNLIPGDIEQTPDVLRRLNAKSSPIWVINDQGRQHIFEGVNGIARYFTADGFYIRPEIGSNSASSEKGKPTGDRVAKNGVSFPRATERKPYSGEATHYQLVDSTPVATATNTSGKQKITWHKMADLPNCSSAQVRKQEVGHYSPISATLDFVAYQGSSAEQRGVARTYKGSKVPYWSGAFPNAQGAEGALSQFWASTVDIRCLPTRFRFVSADGRRFAEYREGTIAWQQPEASVEKPVKATGSSKRAETKSATTKSPGTTTTTVPTAAPTTVPADDGIGRF